MYLFDTRRTLESLVEPSKVTNLNVPSNNNGNVYTIESSAFPYTVELLEEFGQNDGFTQLNRYFSLLSNMADVTQFLRTFANSIHFLSVGDKPCYDFNSNTFFSKNVANISCR